MTRKLNVEVEIHLIPTDKGVRLLASCNKGYQEMVNSLIASEEFNYCVPSNRGSNDMIIYSNGEVTRDVLRDLRKEQVVQRLYPQPYSATELKRVKLILNGTVQSMIRVYKEMRENDDE